MKISQLVISLALSAISVLIVCFIVVKATTSDVKPTLSAVTETTEPGIRSQYHEHLTIDGMECVRVDRRSLSCNWGQYKGH